MADARWKNPHVVLYGRNMVDVCKGAKRIHLQTFVTYGDAEEYAKRVADAMRVAFVNEIRP